MTASINKLLHLGRKLNLRAMPIFSERIAQQSRIYSYTKSFNAFAAYLLPHEVQRLRGAL